MRIYAPVKDFSGWRNNVRFVNGVGETDNPQAIDWFVSHGYEIREVCTTGYLIVDGHEDIEETSTVTLTVANEPDFDSMTPNELRDWMRENGYGSKIKNTRNKEKLLEILRG